MVLHLGEREPQPSDMKQLTLTWNIFRETLRLFPPVGFFARESSRSCPMRDKQVKPGASIIISPWLIQRHREWWVMPDAFDPDRYTRDEAEIGYLRAIKQVFDPKGILNPGKIFD